MRPDQIARLDQHQAANAVWSDSHVTEVAEQLAQGWDDTKCVAHLAVHLATECNVDMETPTALVLLVAHLAVELAHAYRAGLTSLADLAERHGVGDAVQRPAAA